MLKQLLLLSILISTVFSNNKFTVSFDPDYAPFSFTQNGKPYGLIIDIWKKWGETNNYQIEFVNGKTWDNALNLAKDGKVDFFLGTEAYEKWMLSSKAFYQTKTSLFTLKSLKKEIKKIGIIGNDYEELVKNNFEKSNTTSYKTYSDLVNALIDKKVDAIFDDAIALNDFLFMNRFNQYITKLDKLVTYSEISAISNNKEKISIFNKGLKSINNETFIKIEKNWILNESQRYFHSLTKLSEKEQKWLDDNPIVRLGVMNYWPKTEDNTNLHLEIIKLINKYADTNIVPISFNTWEEGYTKAIKGKNLHGIMGLSWSQEREENYFYYTPPYDFTPCYIIIKKNRDDISSIDDLSEKTIYLKANSITHKLIQAKSSKIKVIDKKSAEDMYKSLSTSNEADAFISYFIDKDKLEKYNLKIVKTLYDRYGEVAIGINKQYPFLSSIINKTISNIPKDELTALRNTMDIKSKKILKLTKREKEFLKNHKPIKYVFNPDGEPFEWKDGINNHVGILADLLGHIKKISGLELKEIPSNSWSEAVKKIKNNQADMYSGIGVTPEKLKTMNFTKNNILKVPYVFVSRKGEEYLKGFDSLNGKKIAVIKNYTINTLLKQHYPKLKINLMKNPKKGFQLLQNKNIDVMIVNSATANYFIKKLGFNDLHISYTTNLTLELKIAINKNIPKEAISIINKAIERINSKLVSDAFFKYTNSGGLFNNNEERYLAKKKTLKICTNPTWEPIEFTSNNITQGISLDILDSMKTQLGLKYEFIKTNSWEQSQNFLKNKKCDILPSAIKTAKRKTFANFTDPYLKYDLVIITHKDLPEVSNIDYIIHKKMSRREGSGLISRLKKQYPKIDITETKSTLKSFELVNDKSVDFTISTLPVFLYHKKKYDLKNIKLAGYTPMKYNLSIAVRKDDKQLLNILDKVLKNVPESTIKLVHDKWATPKTIQTINWTLMLQVFVVFIIVLLIVIYWARKLNIAKKAAEVARVEANKAKKEVEAMHKHTRESIEYAALLQDAILPYNKIMGEYFSDYFIHWMPKDTVGGDIWLFDRLRTKDECLLFYIDCTGHGVPGAFVTMIVKAVEREIVAHIMDNPQMDISPAWVMGYFNRAMKTLLKQDNKDSKSNAGWDGGIIYYNKKEKILKFAGAETPLFYINNDGELTTLKGNRYSVGYKKCDMDYQYKETIIEVEKGMKFYCTTDGYLDQNGGKKDFPFGKKRFSNIIKNNFTLTMKEQKKIFLKEIEQYESYIQNNERNDDMTVIAFEI